MSIMFKLNKDGESVLVAKSLLGKIDEKEFKKKAKSLSVEEFSESLPENKKGKFDMVVQRLKELNKMKLSEVGSTMHVNGSERSTTYFYYLGEKVFKIKYSEYEDDINEFPEAIKYGNEYYGEEFMEKTFKEAIKSKDKFRYFSGVKEISKDEYNEYMEEMKVLTSVVSLNKINKEEKASKR